MFVGCIFSIWVYKMKSYIMGSDLEQSLLKRGGEMVVILSIKVKQLPGWGEKSSYL